MLRWIKILSKLSMYHSSCIWTPGSLTLNVFLKEQMTCHAAMSVPTTPSRWQIQVVQGSNMEKHWFTELVQLIWGFKKKILCQNLGEVACLFGYFSIKMMKAPQICKPSKFLGTFWVSFLLFFSKYVCWRQLCWIKSAYDMHYPFFNNKKQQLRTLMEYYVPDLG